MKFSLASVLALAATLTMARSSRPCRSLAAEKTKVMLLGDSITEITCWRPQVWQQLTTAGLASSVDFVGSMTSLQSKCSAPSGFDTNHEGHSGWQAVDIAKNNIAGWVQNTKPDVVNMHLGTNDVNIGKKGVNDILAAYTTIIQAIRGANPNARIIVDKLIPTSWSDATIEAVNSAIPNWVSQNTTPNSPITIADCSRANGFTNAMLEGDGVHPNAAGDQFLAQQIGPKLIDAIKAVQGGSSTPPQSTTLSTATSKTTTSQPAPTGACAQLWGQCGGNGWTGSTCCAQGTCKAANEWYSQCT